jgi:hypothetical protein
MKTPPPPESSANVCYSTELKTEELNLHLRRCEDVKLAFTELPVTVSEMDSDDSG